MTRSGATAASYYATIHLEASKALSDIAKIRGLKNTKALQQDLKVNEDINMGIKLERSEIGFDLFHPMCGLIQMYIQMV
ncbi:hypothetical protein K493DRAFT_365076 [Basidiobolus meristosporus CBS 931.73]|uniref:Uncharacterized protein n=1 Tax=Basidiobolus meristosporus CBS 931.73 TaxID=1314790 RepID=A0A1Y1VSI0_9FUNG|nr:hypothetical protein K493DRAFT_365076 [Basidiobolus meristosporus CBS 931.73]|eukprot:ORX63966.1 hypothetical protein K493DRAFT_365076 [Basidiobolus meristosporus CBS 931.73]